MYITALLLIAQNRKKHKRLSISKSMAKHTEIHPFNEKLLGNKNEDIWNEKGNEINIYYNMDESQNNGFLF